MKYYSLLPDWLKRIRKTCKNVPKGDISAKINECLVTDLKPVNKTAYGKTGNISLQGVYKGQKVKLYSMFSKEQVLLRERVNKLSDQILLPKLITSKGCLVVEEWVEGTPAAQCGKKTKQEISDIVRRYVTCSYRFDTALTRGYKSEAFDYLDYLENRIKNWFFIEDVTLFVERWKVQREKVCSEFVPALSNPDLAYQNFVYNQRSQALYCIDNEFLHIGRGAYMDFYNSMIRYEKPPFQLTDHLTTFYRNTVKLRCIGSACIVGKPQQLNKETLTFEGES